MNSVGRPHADGDRWRCTTCGQSGPDRDNVELPGCLRNGRPHKDEPHRDGLSFTFARPEDQAEHARRRKGDS